jgi:hypothetical protein
MPERIRAVQFGCGPIGCSVARLALQKKTIELIGAVDVARDKVGRDLGEIIGLEKKIGVAISDDYETIGREAQPQVVFHCTGSSLMDVHTQLEGIISTGTNIVSTCEELSYPFWKHRELAHSLHTLAVSHGVTLLSTGINPGFLMDAWPLFMSGVCQQIDMLRVTRVQDASVRRLPFQKKIGAGCTVDQFERLVEKGDIRHVGLTESIAMIADALGWELDRITERIEPLLALKSVQSDHISVEAGKVAGVRQVANGLQEGRVRVVLEFQASLGSLESYDEVFISGTPQLLIRISGGVHGDIGTAAMVVNAAARVVSASPGLITMKDLPITLCTT